MEKQIEKYSDMIYAVLTKAAKDAQKPLGHMYIKIDNRASYIGPDGKALFRDPGTSLTEVLSVEKLVETLFEHQFTDYEEGGTTNIMRSHKDFLKELYMYENRLTLEEVFEELKLKPEESKKLLEGLNLKS